jgi:hypothetical protein
MKLIKKNEGFTCQNCGKIVLPVKHGSSRNHCPYCLYSLHVDNLPGDRKAHCSGLMKPISVKKYKRSWKILHHCELCGKEQFNIIAEDDSTDLLVKL